MEVGVKRVSINNRSFKRKGIIKEIIEDKNFWVEKSFRFWVKVF